MSAAAGPYGAIVMEHFRRPRNEGRLASPDVAREGSNPLCGDRVRIELTMEGHLVAEARFTANACVISVAAASLLTERVRGMSAAAVAAITDEQMLAALGGAVPPARRSCALLPLATMVAGLSAGGGGRRAEQGTPR